MLDRNVRGIGIALCLLTLFIFLTGCGSLKDDTLLTVNAVITEVDAGKQTITVKDDADESTLSDKLFEHCAEIEEAARNRMELIVRSLAEQNGVTEQLKAENQMEWVRQMNACKAQAEEVVKAELIYN